MTTSWDIFKLLMWKNYLLQSRKIWSSVFDLLVPILCCLLVIFLRTASKPEIIDKVSKFSPIRPNDFSIADGFADAANTQQIFNSSEHLSVNFKVKPEVLYSPRNEFIDRIMAIIEDEIEIFASVQSVNNSAELERQMKLDNYYVGIEFADEYRNLKSLPQNLTYKLRFPGEIRSSRSLDIINHNWRTQDLFPPYMQTRARTPADDDEVPGYFREGFLLVQSLIFEAFMKAHNKSSKAPEVYLQKFPYPPGFCDEFLPSLKAVLPMLLSMIFLFPFVNVIKYIMQEREKKLKKLMVIMGVKPHINWLAWFVKFFIYILIIAAIAVFAFRLKWFGSEKAIFTHSSLSLIFFFFIVYSTTTILFAFMMTTFFNKSSIASTFASFLWVMSISLYVAYCEDRTYNHMTRSTKLLLSLVHNIAMGIGVRAIISRETFEGVQWSNMFENYNDSVSFGETLIMMILDGLLYVSAIFVVKFVKKLFKANSSGSECGRDDMSMDKLETFVKIKNLMKVYSNGNTSMDAKPKPAVNELNLSLEKDQITVILGINGAGKSTTMSMLCGEIQPTSGTVYINGIDQLDASSNRISYKSTGIAFQENILFEKLTVHEHLTFYGRLKGNSVADAENEAQNFMKILNLKPNVYAINLSGGMRRKLCMAIALCANSKFVILDEISSGVDPASRREIWNFLQQMKKNRAILMSTHFMLEAEVVADKIAILCEGRLKAFGSPFELKQTFAKTCNLICVKRPLCDSQIVNDFIRQFIPNVMVGSEVGMEITFKFDMDQVLRMHQVLAGLEEKMDELNLESFGISLTSMDEVISKFGTEDCLETSLVPKYSGNSSNFESLSKISTSCSITKQTYDNPKLFFKQFQALLDKKLKIVKRNWKLLMLQFFVPILFAWLKIVYGYNSIKMIDNQKELQLSLQTYLPSKTFMKLATDVDGQSLEHQIYESYKSMLTAENLNFVEVTDDIQDYFINKSRNYMELNYQNLFGISVEAAKVIGWFNNQPFHTMPIALNSVHNAILKASFGSKFGISVVNKPLPYRSETVAANLPAVHISDGSQYILNIGLAMAITFAIFIIPIIKERISKAKSMQMLSGIHPQAYWTSMFLCDYVITVFIAFVTTVATAICVFYESTTEFDQNEAIQQFWRLFVILVYLGVAEFSIGYMLSNFMASPSSGFIKTNILFLIPGTALYIFRTLMELVFRNLPEFEKHFTSFMVKFPHYNFCDGMQKVIEMDGTRQLCDVQCSQFDICNATEQCRNIDICCDTEYFSWSPKGILWHLLRFSIITSTSFYILVLTESRLFKSLYCRILQFRIKISSNQSTMSVGRKCSLEVPAYNIDPDVELESRRVANMPDIELKSYNLVLKNLSKSFGGKQVVKQLSIAVKSGECFGLLGANGAGKTTTFQMLIGDVQASGGEIFIKGMNLKSNLKDIHKLIGYCGQYDAFLDELTARETLCFYSRCRGLRSENIEALIQQLATDFDFGRHLDKQVRFLSGGTRRKLSTAIALIGDPQIIYLDEPTSFMDPLVKRKFWKQIAKIRDSGKTIILSSHSMDEVEVLCTRIGIMMNGEMKCLGSPQYLKNKFGKTVVVTLKLNKLAVNEDAKNSVKRFIDKQLAGAVLKEEFHDMLIYHLTTQLYKWSQIFRTIEEAKEQLDVIDDFSVNQSNLIQVFLQVTNNQE